MVLVTGQAEKVGVVSGWEERVAKSLAATRVLCLTALCQLKVDGEGRESDNYLPSSFAEHVTYFSALKFDTIQGQNSELLQGYMTDASEFSTGKLAYRTAESICAVQVN